jgi:hypothetical protein
VKKGSVMTEAEREKRREAAKAQWTPEAREAARQRAKARGSKSQSPSSGSAPSSDSASSSVPPTLPPAVSAAQSGSGQQLLETLLEKLKATTTPTEETSRPELPDDDAEREAALRPARWPARIPVVAFNETCRLLGLAELSEEEREEGINAFSVLFWQWGLFKDGRVLVALWMFGVAVPRATSAFMLYREREKTKAVGS